MRLLLILLITVSCGKKESSHRLPRQFVSEETIQTEEAEKNFRTILKTQATALNSMTDNSGGFRMNEMITDIAVSRTGLLGLSALKANSGVEIRWKRKTHSDLSSDEKVDASFEGDTSTDAATDVVVKLVLASGKVKVTPKVRKRIHQSLGQIKKLVDEADGSVPGNWDFKGARFDLNFAASGEVFFFAEAGPNLRLRMEWNHRKGNTKGHSQAARFIRKTMNVLNAVSPEIVLPGFTTRQLSIGVGTTYKGDFGVWKYSSGFMGFLIFVPNTSKSFYVPSEESFIIGGLDEKNLQVTSLSSERFVTGLRKSLRTASFFADASRSLFGSWTVSEIKTVNDISHTGLFGLADFTTRGALEIDFRRNN